VLIKNQTFIKKLYNVNHLNKTTNYQHDFQQ